MLLDVDVIDVSYKLRKLKYFSPHLLFKLVKKLRKRHAMLQLRRVGEHVYVVILMRTMTS